MIEEDIGELTDKFERDIAILQDQVALLTARLNEQSGMPGTWMKSDHYPDFGPMYHFFTEYEYSGFSLWVREVKEEDSFKSLYQVRGRVLRFNESPSPVLAVICAHFPARGLSVFTES